MKGFTLNALLQVLEPTAYVHVCDHDLCTEICVGLVKDLVIQLKQDKSRAKLSVVQIYLFHNIHNSELVVHVRKVDK